LVDRRRIFRRFTSRGTKFRISELWGDSVRCGSMAPRFGDKYYLHPQSSHLRQYVFLKVRNHLPDYTVSSHKTMNLHLHGNLTPHVRSLCCRFTSIMSTGRVTPKIVLWRGVTPCSLVETYRLFTGPCCLHVLLWRQQDRVKCPDTSIRIHGVTVQSASVLGVTTFRISAVAELKGCLVD
jgi:hypothetical protein